MQVVEVPDNRLRVKTKPVKKVTPTLLSTIKEMTKLTKTFDDPEGVGLASTQVGLDGKYFIAKHEDGHFQAFFNPRILKASKKMRVYMEGCLSIPNYWGEVSRHAWVDVEYLNEKGQKVSERLQGLMAWIYQHECDHLEGKLFVDNVLQQKGRFFKVTGHDRAGGEIFEEIKLGLQ